MRPHNIRHPVDFYLTYETLSVTIIIKGTAMRITVYEKPNDDRIALSNIDGVVTEYAPQKIHFIWVGGPFRQSIYRVLYP